MEIKVFKTENHFNLIVKRNKSNITLDIEQNQESKNYKFLFRFTPKTFHELLEYIEMVSNKVWVGLDPKEATGISSDYSEYYDKKLDNNGYLNISKDVLIIERPSLNSEKLYQFNKGKMESFIYDFRKIVTL